MYLTHRQSKSQLFCILPINSSSLKLLKISGILTPPKYFFPAISHGVGGGVERSISASLRNPHSKKKLICKAGCQPFRVPCGDWGQWESLLDWGYKSPLNPMTQQKLDACEMTLCSVLKGQSANLQHSKGRWKMQCQNQANWSHPPPLETLKKCKACVASG